jgi:hypothetical protein
VGLSWGPEQGEEEISMTNQVSDDQFPAELPPGIRARKLPWNIGTIVSIRNVLINNILTKFDFEIAIFFPITFFLSLKHREFYMGAEVPEHRDAFEPIFGCSVSLLLRRAKRGGEFKCEKSFLNLTRLNIFNGTRYLKRTQDRDIQTALELARNL